MNRLTDQYAPLLETLEATNGAPDLILELADTWPKRARGWLGRRVIHAHEALWLKRCAFIHTFGMSCAIGVFFLDRNGCVLKVSPSVAPDRLAGCWTADSTIETRAFQPSELESMVSRVRRAIVQAQGSETPKRN